MIDKATITIEIAGGLTDDGFKKLNDLAVRDNGKVMLHDIVQLIPNGEKRFDNLILTEIGRYRDTKHLGGSIAVGGTETILKLEI